VLWRFVQIGGAAQLVDVVEVRPHA